MRYSLEKLLLLLVGHSFVFVLTACALFGGGQELKRARGYSLTAPKTWVPSPGEGESDKSYRLPSGSVVTVVSSCDKHPDTSLDVLTRQLLIGTRNVQVIKRKKISVSGSEGLYSQVKAVMNGTKFHMDLFVVPKNKCVFDFSLLSNKPISDSESQEFQAFLQSLEYGTN